MTDRPVYLFLIRGLPGSGKTTLAAILASKMGLRHYEADQFFEKDGRYYFDASKLGAAHAECHSKTKEALSMGVPVVVSNTFTTRREMEPYFKMAAELGVSVHVIKAEGNFKSVHNVPAEVLDKMRSRWEEAHD
jgi:predicted kinase